MRVRETGVNQNAPAGRTYWLISGGPEPGGVFVLNHDGFEKSLPVFGFREEAEMFLRLGGRDGDGWHARESEAGELTSLLGGPCADVESVALDPLPEILEDGAVGLVRVRRERFLERISASGSEERKAL